MDSNKTGNKHTERFVNGISAVLLNLEIVNVNQSKIYGSFRLGCWQYNFFYRSC